MFSLYIILLLFKKLDNLRHLSDSLLVKLEPFSLLCLEIRNYQVCAFDLEATLCEEFSENLVCLSTKAKY